MNGHERTEPTEPTVSRRAVLAGAGTMAGAIAVATTTRPAGATPPPLAPTDPALTQAALAAQAGFPPLAVVPGVRYRTWSYHDATPTNWSYGRVITSTGAHTSTPASMRIGLGLEAGIAVTEIAFAAQNSSGASAIGSVDRHPLVGGSPTQLGSVTIPSGLSNVQVVSSAIANKVIGEAESVSAGLVTSSSVRFFGFRLGYIPFGFGYVPIAPKRVYDSRAGNPPLGVTKGQLTNNSRVINLLNGVTLPAGVTPVGLLVNLAVVNTSASGFLSLYQNGIPDPGTSSINWFTANEIVANTTYTGIDTSGNAIAKVPANASTDFFIDVVGYYA